jgi:ubiquinone/menaquinone biosynthesis C-methylase UbiE
MKLFINETNKVKTQYSKANGLNTRLSIHEKYSTNKMGLGNWFFTLYNIENGMKVLELGCGTGAMWTNHKDEIEKCSEIVFSDFSENMVETAKTNIGTFPNAKYQVIDIQDIPFEDGYFDIVIANFMLYHVPNLEKALSEASRVLKKGGVFYAGTSGEHGVMETIVSWLGFEGVYVNTFSLDNGKERLENHFSDVKIMKYADSLEVTNLDDLMEYIYSGITFKNAVTLPKEDVREILESHMENGVLTLPKEPGTFVSIK